MSDGSWFQRYWLNGDKAPSWGNFMHSTQMDETGITLYALNKYYKTLSGIQRDLFLDDVWLCVLQAAEYLMKRTGRGLHEPCMDLWETCYGTFTYTNASIYGGLSAAADVALMRHERGLSTRWLNRSEYIKQQTIDRLWLDEGYFAKAIMNDVVDVTVDASILGTITPFKLLSPEKEQEREMIKSIIRALEQKLAIKVNGYQGICRYENDHYIGGNPWIVSTLWLSKALLYLAAYEPDGREEYIERALKYICWSLEGTTGPGLFPEQVDKHTGRPAWAIPLGWSHSLFIDNIILLDALEKRYLNMEGKNPCG